ncbi:PAS domain-containing protein [Rhizobium sp. SSA_523]|uniref:PAS domain-containing protein n=1 Tax=Rhizobium sp. SSA_523 TaxID=2952477 RepID=UPI0020911F2A|nr:PAS domain-containing protein [Rhizobium sp. SSA_523]MCO5733835.1 PAS domain-containing protein [Rhizobium sp. SSA_523]WKC24896.1 PAS domain-containing protein [Rhizobium sp. SSA_523]
MRSEKAREIHRYWNSLRRGGAAPLRADFQPMAIRQRLPDLFMLDLADADFRFRLAGTRICDMFGTELRGSNFLSLWQAESRDRALEAALSALRTEDAEFISLRVPAASGWQDCDMLLLPIRSSGHLADRLLGGLFAQTGVSLDRPVPRGSLELESWRPAHWSPAATRTAVPPIRTVPSHQQFDIRLVLQRLFDTARSARRR